MNKPSVIFFGNGPLAEHTLAVLEESCDILAHIRTREDLTEAIALKKSHPEAFGILASFGVLIKSDVLEAFEPEGILNLHPSLLPEFRGASPIESAILSGASEFSFSIMKLAREMDAGPIYHQETMTNLPLDKAEIYRALATSGAKWLVEHLPEIRTLTPTPQDHAAATFCGKFDKSMSLLDPEHHSASEIYRQIVAFQGFPKPKYVFYGKTCIILEAHLVDVSDAICDIGAAVSASSPLMIKCADRSFVAVDRLQPEGKKPMDAVSFLNGYRK